MPAACWRCRHAVRLAAAAAASTPLLSAHLRTVIHQATHIEYIAAYIYIQQHMYCYIAPELTITTSSSKSSHPSAAAASGAAAALLLSAKRSLLRRLAGEQGLREGGGCGCSRCGCGRREEEASGAMLVAAVAAASFFILSIVAGASSAARVAAECASGRSAAGSASSAGGAGATPSCSVRGVGRGLCTRHAARTGSAGAGHIYSSMRTYI